MSDAHTGDTLPAEHFASLARLEDRYWWHQTRYRAALAALQRAGAQSDWSLGDVGCGTGGFLRFLRARGFTRLAGFDMSPVALAAAVESGADVHTVDLESPFTLAGAPFDALVALDVMEHLADDTAFLRTAAADLRPGGLLFLSVPAFAHLASRWDERLRHHRRYTRRSLIAVARAAGLAPLHSSYLFAVVYPAALLRHWTGWHDGRESCEFPPVSPLTGRLLSWLGRAEAALPPALRAPLGTSVTLLARKPCGG
ncbi:MAG TPA: class I SAM-dependent methyltransferase [Thermoanaerobaculia bacterium]|jgi:SAM-dependent methyltransferase|nr:class I SAM-dependent methyltransferase [Thermoanaerobaculia bacterium]